MMNCIEGLRVVFGQMDQLLAQLSPQAYTCPLAVFGGSTLGQHFRHIIDFAQCLLRDVAQNAPVDYAARTRDAHLECEPTQARAVLAKLIEAFEDADEHQTILVRADFLSIDSEVQRPVVSSTVGRELMFVHDHAVHHLAMIRMGIRAAFPDIRLNPAIGVAPATLRFWQQ